MSPMESPDVLEDGRWECRDLIQRWVPEVVTRNSPDLPEPANRRPENGASPILRWHGRRALTAHRSTPTKGG